MALAAYNLVRMAKLMPPPSSPGAVPASELASNGGSMPEPARSLFPKLAFFISLLDNDSDGGSTVSRR